METASMERGVKGNGKKGETREAEKGKTEIGGKEERMM